MIKNINYNLTRSGKTLIELLFVLLILAIISIIIVPKLFWTNKIELDIAAQELISNLQYCQNMSMRYYMTKFQDDASQQTYSPKDCDLWGIQFHDDGTGYHQTFVQLVNNDDYIYKKLERNYLNGKYSEPVDSCLRFQTPIYSSNIKYSIPNMNCNNCLKNTIFFDSLGRLICCDSSNINRSYIQINLSYINQEENNINKTTIKIDTSTGYISKE